MVYRATIIAILVLVGGNVTARISNVEPVALRRPLAQLSYTLGEWTGVEAARFDRRTLELLGVDEYVNRAYVGAAKAPVWLYIGFFASQRDGDTMHSPLNCLPGVGWEPVERRRTTVSVQPNAETSTRQIHVNEIVVQKGAVRQIVIYWYQSHGRVTGNEYASKAFTMVDAIRLNRTDAAIVRVIAPVIGDIDSARRQASTFVSALFPHLDSHLPL